jgi:hypothetical protein
VAQRPAWRDVEAHESGARWSALAAEECGDEGAVERSESSGVAAFGGCRGKRRDGFSTARRGDARGDGCMRRAWSGCGDQSAASVRGGVSGRVAVACATPAFGRRLSGA